MNYKPTKEMMNLINDLKKKGVINQKQIDEFHQKLVEATRDAVQDAIDAVLPNQSNTREIVVSVSSDGNIELSLSLHEMKKFYGSDCEIFYCIGEPGTILACLEHILYGVSFEDMTNLDLNTEEKMWRFTQEYQFLTEKNLREAMAECGVKPKEDLTIPCPKDAEVRTPEGYVINRYHGYEYYERVDHFFTDYPTAKYFKLNIHIPANKHMEDDATVYLLADSQLRTIDVFDSIDSLMYEYSLNNLRLREVFCSSVFVSKCKWSEISKSN